MTLVCSFIRLFIPLLIRSPVCVYTLEERLKSEKH